MQRISIALNALISREEYRLLWVCLKSPKPTDRPQNSVGQTVGPATEKARRPNVIRRQRGTMSLKVVDVVYALPTGGPTAQVRRLGPKVGGRLALFCIHRVNRVNSLNDSVTESG